MQEFTTEPTKNSYRRAIRSLALNVLTFNQGERIMESQAELQRANAEKVSTLLALINEMEEKKSRIAELNKYDHTETGTAASTRPFGIKFVGGNTHTSFFPKNNEIGEEIAVFFNSLFQGFIDEAATEMKELLA